MRDETEILARAESDGLTEKQHKALAALVSEPTLKDAAKAAGCSVSTLWRYLQDADFARRLRELRRESVAQAAARLQRDSGEAARVMYELMTGAEVPPAVGLGAARSVVENAFRSLEADELLRRVEELEQFIKRKAEGDELDATDESGEGEDQ